MLVGVKTCTATLEINLTVSEKIGNQSSSRVSNTTLGHTAKGAPSYHKVKFSTIFIAELFEIAITWKTT